METNQNKSAKVKNTLFKNKLENQTWYFYNWEILIIVALALLVAFFNYLPHLVGSQEEATIFFNNGDKYVPNYLRDNIVYSSFSISITIIVAIFIGIYTEIGKFAGKYSSAIFTLVPSLVWLLSARSSNHIKDLIETQNILEQVIFWSSVSIFALFTLSFFVFWFLFKLNLLNYSKLRLALINNIINRLIVVFVNITILFMLGYTLVNFGFFTLSLGDVSPSDQQAFFEKTGLESGQYNLQSENFVTYLAIIAICFALIMVAINLSNVFTKKNLEAQEKDEQQDLSIKLKSINNDKSILEKGDTSG